MTKFIYNRSLVLGGSKGIGKSIAQLLKDISKEVFAFSSKDIDLSNLDSVDKFLKKYTFTDILVLNGAGPPNLKFEDMAFLKVLKSMGKLNDKNQFRFDFGGSQNFIPLT